MPNKEIPKHCENCFRCPARLIRVPAKDINTIRIITNSIIDKCRNGIISGYVKISLINF